MIRKSVSTFLTVLPSKISPLFYSVVTMITILIITSIPLTDTINNKIYDSFIWLRYKSTLAKNNWQADQNFIDSNIVIIKIDHKSLNYMSKRVGDYPWPRSVYGDVVNKLSQDKAQSIFFDIQFSERQLTSKERLEKILNMKYNYSDKKSKFLSDQVFVDFSAIKESFLYNKDQLAQIGVSVDDVIASLNIVYNNNDVYFIRAVRDAGNVFLPFLALKDSDFKYSTQTLEKIIESSIEADSTNSDLRAWAYSFKLPISSLVKYAYSVNNVSYITFRNEINRDIPTVIKFKDRLYPHICISLRNYFYNKGINNFEVNYSSSSNKGSLSIPGSEITMQIDSLARTLVSFRAGEKDFKSISFSDFIYPDNDSIEAFNRSLIKDKIVLIGATAPILRDVIETPLGLMPGIIYHANYLNDLLRNDFIKKFSGYTSLIVLFLILILLSYIYYISSNAFLDIIIFSLSMVSIFLLFFILFQQYSIYIPTLEYFIGFLLIFIIISSAKLINAKKERSGILKTFEKYVSSNIVKELLEHPEKVKLGGESRNISILFSDIRSFTTFSENREPKEVIERLNHFFTEMTDVIYESNGTLDKYIGDEIMALFGAPVDFEDHKYKACVAAVMMVRKLKTLTAQWVKDGIEPFEIGIGINSGDVIVGNIGSSKVMDYTVIGDSVNLAARVEALTRNYSSSILITEFTYSGIEHLVEVDFIDSVVVKGKKKSVIIYSLKSIKLESGEIVYIN